VKWEDNVQVRWKDDLRPDPDQCPPGCEDAAFDPQLILTRSGVVVSSMRTFWGSWKLLVHCDDGQMREVGASCVEVMSCASV